MLSSEDREIMLRAERIYEERLKGDLEKAHMHEYVVIEPDSGDFYLGRTLSEATAQARKAHPDRRSHIMRVGHRAAVEMVGLSMIGTRCLRMTEGGIAIKAR